MRLLFATEVFPHPLDRGERIRVRNLLEAAAREFEVTFVCPKPRDPHPREALDCVAHTVLFDTEAPTALDGRLFFDAMRSSLGSPISKMLRGRMQFLRVLESLDLDAFDLIWAERPHVGRLFRRRSSRTIVDFDDVSYLKLARLIRLQGWSLGSLHNVYRYLVYRHAELSQFRSFLGIAVCSQEDQSHLRARKAGSVCVVPNGVTVPDSPPLRRRRRPGEPLRLVFLGNMTYDPNMDAVDFFAREVLRSVHGIVEAFDVIGPPPPEDFQRRYGPPARFLGFVADLSEALSTYDAMVAPIRFGSGTKLKVLEAMANALPLILTPCAAEGLHLQHDVHALVASTAQEICQALNRLAESPDLGHRLAMQAYALASSRFSWDAIQTTLSTELKRLAFAAAAAPDRPKWR